ncbi:MAG TPA: septum site-determining protein MinC [Firmicutes bacterium]|nr:septum site-determining protein MinC [Bacillota bacterium]
MIPSPAPLNPKQQMVFKGFKHGLTLLLPEEGDFSWIYNELKRRLDEASDFFRGASLTVVTKEHRFTTEERRLLEALCADHEVRMRLDSDQSPMLEEVKEKQAFVPTLMVKRTLRGGQRVEFEGNVVVKGDVNAGAEVLATGDIIILGALRGIAHAGAAGDTSAEVIAFDFHPVQLRIAGFIARPPENAPRSRHPEVARVRGEAIVVEKY